MVINRKTVNLLLWVCISLFLSGCYERVQLAPVTSGDAKERPYYIVNKGDTLFSIAWKHEKTVSEIAYYNHLSANSTLQPGQKLSLISKKKQLKTTRAVRKSKAKSKQTKKYYKGTKL